MKLTGNLDPSTKLKWGLGFIAPPGTGPKTEGKTHCRQCAHLLEQTEPIEHSERMRHFFFCGPVVEKIGPIKAIDKETQSCSKFKEKTRKTNR